MDFPCHKHAQIQKDQQYDQRQLQCTYTSSLYSFQSSQRVDLIGMNKEMMCMYIEAVSDRIADLFGFEHVYGTENPFDFMRALDVQNVTNFFEKRVSEYQRPTDRSLSFDESF